VSGRLVGERGLALGKDWAKSCWRSGVYVSVKTLSPLNFPSFNLASFLPGCSLSIKEFGVGGLSHICVKRRGTQNWWQLSDT